ncbi:MAG TPA: hypothetical protein VFJ58_20710 [Armatimonadota bacterium]|nr:hypothetical protein [Armatimonadota bacterium]
MLVGMLTGAWITPANPTAAPASRVESVAQVAQGVGFRGRVEEAAQIA